MGADLTVKFAGVKFKNPFVLSSGEVSIDSKMFRRAIDAGAAGVTTKSVSTEPVTWVNPRPSGMFLDKYGLPHTVHAAYHNRTPEQGVKDIQEIKAYAKKHDVVVIGNLTESAAKLENWRKVSKKLEEAGADIIEIQVACSIIGRTVEQAGIRVSTAPSTKPLENIIKAVKESVAVPIMPKIVWEHETFLRRNIPAVEKAGSNAIHIQGRIPGAYVDIEKGRPLIPDLNIGGHWARQTCTYVVAVTDGLTDIPIASSGGICTPRDAIERVMVGADLLEVHGAIAYYGYHRFKPLIDGMRIFLDTKGYSRVKDIVGVARPYIWDAYDRGAKYLDWLESMDINVEKGRYYTPKENVVLKIDYDKCIGCGICAYCNWGAITMKDDRPVYNPGECDRCGICWSRCPVDAISATYKGKPVWPELGRLHPKYNRFEPTL